MDLRFLFKTKPKKKKKYQFLKSDASILQMYVKVSSTNLKTGLEISLKICFHQFFGKCRTSLLILFLSPLSLAEKDLDYFPDNQLNQKAHAFQETENTNYPDAGFAHTACTWYV